jgi:uncharacterized membrane protein YphA (DoxX/SURF4 family)
MKFKNIIVEIIVFLFIILFVYAALAKLLDYEKFLVQLGQSPLLTAFAGWVAWSIPTVEIIIAVMLAVPRWRNAGLYAAFSLMVMFSAYIVAIVQFSDNIPCSCGGILEGMTWNQHLIFNIFFVLLALTGIVLRASQEERKDKERVMA